MCICPVCRSLPHIPCHQSQALRACTFSWHNVMPACWMTHWAYSRLLSTSSNCAEFEERVWHQAGSVSEVAALVRRESISGCPLVSWTAHEWGANSQSWGDPHGPRVTYPKKRKSTSNNRQNDRNTSILPIYIRFELKLSSKRTKANIMTIKVGKLIHWPSKAAKEN